MSTTFLQKVAEQLPSIDGDWTEVRPWYEVQRYLGQIHLARQSGSRPLPGPGQVLLRIVAGGICGSDIRVVTGNKETASDAKRFVTLGHEGVGIVTGIGDGVVGLKPGDVVAVLPHIHLQRGIDRQCLTLRIDPTCIGSGHTLHMGWDIDGVFADYVLIPARNLVRVASKYLHLARELAPGLKEAIFALVEPMLCTLSAYELLELQLRKLLGRDLTPGRALIIGSGPIGLLHGLVLIDRGFEIWFADKLQKRAALAQWCVGKRGDVIASQNRSEGYDLVIITASSVDAIRMGEIQVRDGGILYLFAGLNTADRTALDQANIFFYERLHRSAKGLLTTTRLSNEDKSILYLGHSGYFEKLASAAIAMVARYAVELDRAVTGVIPGWASPHVASRLPGGADWMTSDGAPAIISVLKGAVLSETHCKLLVLADR